MPETSKHFEINPSRELLPDEATVYSLLLAAYNEGKKDSVPEEVLTKMAVAAVEKLKLLTKASKAGYKKAA